MRGNDRGRGGFRGGGGGFRGRGGSRGGRGGDRGGGGSFRSRGGSRGGRGGSRGGRGFSKPGFSPGRGGNRGGSFVRGGNRGNFSGSNDKQYAPKHDKKNDTFNDFMDEDDVPETTVPKSQTKNKFAKKKEVHTPKKMKMDENFEEDDDSDNEEDSDDSDKDVDSDEDNESASDDHESSDEEELDEEALEKKLKGMKKKMNGKKPKAVQESDSNDEEDSDEESSDEEVQVSFGDSDPRGEDSDDKVQADSSDEEGGDSDDEDQADSSDEEDGNFDQVASSNEEGGDSDDDSDVPVAASDEEPEDSDEEGGDLEEESGDSEISDEEDVQVEILKKNDSKKKKMNGQEAKPKLEKAGQKRQRTVSNDSEQNLSLQATELSINASGNFAAEAKVSKKNKKKADGNLASNAAEAKVSKKDKKKAKATETSKPKADELALKKMTAGVENEEFRVHVGHLPKDTKKESLTKFIRKQGIEIQSVFIKKHEKGQFAFVQLKDEKNFEKVLALDGKKFGSEKLKFSKAKTMDDSENAPGSPNKSYKGNPEMDARTLFVKYLPRIDIKETITLLKKEFPGGVEYRVPSVANQKNRGFAFILYEDAVTVAKYVKEKKGLKFEGKTLFLDFCSKDKSSKSPKKTPVSGKPGQTNVLLVKNLNFQTGNEAILKHFDAVAVRRALKREQRKKNLGLAFIEFDTPAKAEQVFQKMNGSTLEGKKIQLDYGTPLKPDAQAQFAKVNSSAVKVESKSGKPVIKKQKLDVKKKSDDDEEDDDDDEEMEADSDEEEDSDD